MCLPRLEALDALLLDLDDTILDDRAGVEPAWSAALACIRAARPEVDPVRLRGAIDERTAWYWADPERERQGRLDLFRARLELIRPALAEVGVDDEGLAREAAQHYTQVRDASHRLFDGVLEVLEQLRRRLPRLALVTNGAAGAQRAKIDRFGLERFFDHIQVEGEFGAGKPERRAFLAVADALSAAPGRCLMFGDSYRNDVLGALGAGMHAAWLDAAGAGPPAGPPRRPHATLRSLQELAERLLC